MPPRFETDQIEKWGVSIVALRDVEAHTEALVAPELGSNCLAFRVNGGRAAWQVLHEPADGSALRSDPTHYGIPILFPWPNRIRGGHFTYRGREFVIRGNTSGGHAIHGLVRDSRWSVEAQGGDEDGAYIRCSVEVEPDASHPFHARLSVEYRLKGGSLHVDSRAVNLSSRPMPMGFGLHPWFGLPLGVSGSRDDCEIKADAALVWELEELIPTGRMIAPPTNVDPREWRPLRGLSLDHVYSALSLRDGWFTASVRDPASGRQIDVRSDITFREHVIYAPQGRDVLCLEPYTCATDAFNLEARGIQAGVLDLAPGDDWRGQVEIEATGLPPH